MKQHESQVENLHEQVKNIKETKDDSGTVEEDMEKFNKKWTVVFEKLSKSWRNRMIRYYNELGCDRIKSYQCKYCKQQNNYTWIILSCGSQYHILL